MENVIFYFSGTGNSLQVAKDIAEKLEECEVVNLAKFRTATEINAKRIGIVFPVYFWGVPNIIKKFLSEIKLAGTPYIFTVATCGNAAGASLLQVNDLLKIKNQKLSSGFIIKMPENYIIYYDADNSEKQQQRFYDEKNKIPYISQIVIGKKEVPFEKSKYVIDTLFGKALNNAIVHKFPSKDGNFTVHDQCTGCGKCEKVCSVNNITMENNKPSWNHHCEFCLGCLQNCPVNAIDYGNKTQKRKRYVNPNV
jgi:Ferredoxin